LTLIVRAALARVFAVIDQLRAVLALPVVAEFRF